MDKELSIESPHRLHSGWIVWYHSYLDKNWDMNSYKSILQINTIEDLLVLINSWNTCLPSVTEGMFFIMRKVDNDTIINPRWEDKHNITGGSWSVKITRNNVFSAWTELSMALIGETITENNSLSTIVNGISISPKKYFCIVKIWNNDNSYNTDDVISRKIPFLDLSKMLYKSNDSNIEMPEPQPSMDIDKMEVKYEVVGMDDHYTTVEEAEARAREMGGGGHHEVKVTCWSQITCYFGVTCGKSSC